MNSRLLGLVASVLGAVSVPDAATSTTPLSELGRQFVNTRYLAYFHYGMNSFDDGVSGRHDDWGTGKVPASSWNPAGLDCNQWADALIAGKMAGGILTTKHHDGFCLWDSKAPDPNNPSQASTYDVGAAPVKTDVVKAFTDAFRAKGLKIGLYYSIMDRHYSIQAGKVTAAKVNYEKAQIRELLTNYGKIDYINFDGWNSGDQNLGHPDFDDLPFHELYNLVKSIQPDCLVLQHQYETNLAHTEVPFADALGGAVPTTTYMRPTAGSDCIQNWWFWDNGIAVNKSVSYILDKLNVYNSRTGVYVLNIGPNRNGRLDADVVSRLAEVGRAWTKPADIAMAGANWGYMYDVTRNLAFMRPSSQSSTAPSVTDYRARPRAEIALDGVTEGNQQMNQTSLTNSQAQPWWRVDLQSERTIDTIIIYNRTGTGASALSDFSISILDSGNTQVWTQRQTTAPSPVLKVTVGEKKGRHVRIQLTGTGALALAEVVVLEKLQPTATQKKQPGPEHGKVGIRRAGEEYDLAGRKSRASAWVRLFGPLVR